MSRKPISLTRNSKEKSFPIVAIGASAGGLEAISVLFENLPPDTGMAFIYVQHLSPNHKSFLTSILSKLTKMKVQEIENMEHIAPNNVYVIPPNKGIEVTDGHIKLLPRPKTPSTKLTIDGLFTSLARTHKENVIGVILSGYASDGMIGLKAIKEAGGLTFAQDDSAQARSMPESAIASGMVDYVMSPKEIAGELTRFSKNGFRRPGNKRFQRPGKGGKQAKESADDNSSDLKTIYQLLYKETGVDFSHYKIPTMKRRLHHKMIPSGAKTIKEYVKLLLKKNTEAGLLYADLLIHVTGFFRDAEVFQYLKTTLLPKLLKSKSAGEPLRIWVPACSSGQEAYSIAMLISELQDKKSRKVPVQIFATDLSEEVIRIARIGEYSQNEMKGVSQKQITRFFTKAGDRFQVAKELRTMCVFAPHNIVRDPPFSRMDFISCRNLMIYFDAVAQKKTFATLHFTLKDGGYLLLGKAETTGTSSQFFTRINKKIKLYSRKQNSGVRRIPELSPQFPGSNSTKRKTNLSSKNINTHPTDIGNAIDSVILSRYMPACAVVNKEMEILQFRGPVSLYLAHPSGKASLNILKMTRPEFAFELRTAIHKAIKTKQSVHKSGIEIKIESVSRYMSLEVSPLKIEWDEPLLLIVFTTQEQVEQITENGKGGKINSIRKDRKIKILTEELNTTRAEINSIIESQETTQEELQAANEEVVSSNEELQSLNEELETSKEEIEATNEELLTTNQELQLRTDLLGESHEYSEAIISSIQEPMLVLHKDFSIKSANKSFFKKFHVKKEQTEGMSLFELGNKQWNIPKLRKVLFDIISRNKSFENFEVTHTFPGIGKKAMLLNGHLIVQKVHREQLILLAITDVTEVKRSAIAYQLKERAEELSKANTELIIQNKEKEKRAEELLVANKELKFQNKEKEKRVADLAIAGIELKFQQEEKEKRERANKKLEAAMRTAEGAVKAKQQFLSNMSHEIRTPMNAIIGFTKVVLKTELSAKQRDYLSAIKTSGDSLIVLINDILDLAKVDSGKMTFEKIPFKMADSLSDMLHLFETRIQEKNLKLEKIYDTKIPEILVGDPIRLHQIVLNLISNALKFTTKGKITVHARLLKEDEQHATVEFLVNDTGIGIEKNKLTTIFENFQQASNETSRLYGGTGLGLAICKQLVESQGGSIHVVSKVGQGSTFSFILSFLKADLPAELEVEPVDLHSEIRDIKILVVEDIPLNQLLMKTLLDDFGFESDFASNGKVAIEKLLHKSYDVILMDLQMPEMNGFEATDYIRKEMKSVIPILALTADVTTVDVEKCKAFGMNDYIAKPIDEKLLYSKIVDLVKRPFIAKRFNYIDLANLIKLTKSKSSLMVEMISLYLTQTPPLLKTMRESFQDKDWSSLHAAVHKLIPSFSIMGIRKEYEDMAKNIQEYAVTKQPAEGVADLILQLGNACSQACIELEEEVKNIKSAVRV